MRRPFLAAFAVLFTAACASAPPPAPPKPVEPSFEQKMAAILRLEDHRILRDTAPTVAAAPQVRSLLLERNQALPGPCRMYHCL